jgi:signal transduction histidine kinase
VLLNLLTNVERYAYPDGAGGRVEVRLRTAVPPGPASFAISVQDFGRGIEPDALRRVFEPFFTTGRGRGGTGLGLAIVQNIVSTALQGWVAIESSPGAGTTATIVVPQTIRERETGGE